MHGNDIEIYPEDNFFTRYFNFVGYPHNTEASLVCHRWSSISILAAALGRNFLFPFGIGDLMPNQYIQIIGVPATRKSTAIKQAKRLLKQSGFSNFSPESISLERFLMDLHELTWGSEDEQEKANDFLLEETIFGTSNPKETAESLDIAEYYIASDEFVDFIGRNNIQFISLLGSLWDYQGVFDRKLKHSKTVYANNPTINIIAGNTPECFAQAFPPEVQGQGFFSRLLLIHAEPTGRKIDFPEPPSLEATKLVLDYLKDIKLRCNGIAKVTEEAKDLCRIINRDKSFILSDSRFQHYNGRRFTHLLKLSLVMAAGRMSNRVDSCDVTMANTILTFAEYQMPKAMGFFGRGRNSLIMHKIVEVITANDGCTMRDIIKYVQNDLDNMSILGDLLNSLKSTDKILIHEGIFYSKSEQRVMVDTLTVKPTWIFQEERRY